METTMTATRIDRGSTASTTIYSEGGDLVFERTFDAPRELVWQALTDPTRIPHWWGPKGTTTTVVEMDVRPGGTWRYLSHAADREDVAFYGEYREVDPPKGYTWTFMFDVPGVGPQGGPETFVLTELDGRTKLTSTSHFGSPEIIDGALATGMVRGAIETWDRLEALLAQG
jgi:uncharacterized protein YndB with AHSA1/START domain